MEEKKLLLKASEYFTSKDYDKAIEFYQKALKLDPYHELTYIKLSQCFKQKNKLSQSLELINKALSLKPNYIIGLAEKAEVLISMNQLTEALKVTDFAIKKFPNFVKSFCLKGKILTIKENINDALKYFDKAIALNENYFDAHFGNGVALTVQGYYIEGAKCLEKAIQIYERNTSSLNPIAVSDYSKALYYKAKCLFNCRKINEALEDINSAIEIEGGEMEENNEINDNDLYSGNNITSEDIRKIYTQLKKKIEKGIEENQNINQGSNYNLSLCSDNNLLFDGDINSPSNNETKKNNNSNRNKNSNLKSGEKKRGNANNNSNNNINNNSNSNGNCNNNSNKKNQKLTKFISLNSNKSGGVYSSIENIEDLASDTDNKIVYPEEGKKESTDANNNNQKEYEDAIFKGKEQLKAKNKKEAIEYFDKSISLNPSSAEPYKLKASILKSQNKKEEALPLYMKAYNLNTNKIEEEDLLLNIANLNYSLSNTNEALYYYNLILSKNKTNEHALNGKAACLFTSQQYKESIEIYKTILSKVNKNDTNALFNEAVCYFMLGNYKEALSTYTQITKLKQGNYQVYINMAQCEEELNHSEIAITFYDKALSLLNKNNTVEKKDILYKKGYCCFEVDKLNEAENAFTDIIKEDPNYAKAFCGLGLVYNKRGKFKEAINYYNKAIEKDKNNPLYYLYKSFGLFDMKNKTEGKKCLNLCENAVNKSKGELSNDMITQIKEKINKLREENKI